MTRLSQTIPVLLMITFMTGPVSAGEDPPDLKKKRNFSDALRVGDEAPLFTLKALHGDETFELESSRGKKPVVLFFGSYT